MSDTLIAVVAASAKGDAKEHESFKGRAKAAMGAARDNGIVLDKEIQFKGALVALASLYQEDGDDEMVGRIKAEIAQLRAINAMQAGVPIDIDGLMKQKHEPLGLMGLWHESAEK